MAQTSLMPDPKVQFIDEDGNPYSGGKVYTYEPGTTTPKSTYTDSTGTVANTNPVILDTAGRAAIWLDGYTKIVLKDSLDNTIYTVDNVSSAYFQSNTMSQWSALGVTPTYIGATQFSVPGDYTSTFLQYLRVRATISAGFIYGYVASNSTYGAGVTTVTMTWDSTTLDNTLTAISTSILTPTNVGYPQNIVTLAGTQTLTSKTLTSPTINTATITGGTIANATISGTSMLKLVASSEVSGAAVTAVTISGLTSSTQKSYVFIAKIKSTNAAATTYNVTFNADTGANYGYEYVVATGAVASAAQATAQNSILTGATAAANTYTFISGRIFAYPATFPKLCDIVVGQNISGTTIGSMAQIAAVWSNTADQLTSITVTASTATGINIGSYFEVWAVN